MNFLRTNLPEIDSWWSVGPEVREILYEIAKLNLHRKILEIGCYNGYSTSAFVGALDDGADFHLTLCDTKIKPPVVQMATKHPDKIIIRETKSEDLIDDSFDLIFVDGDHSLPAVGRELMLLLKSNTKTIIAHDTMAPHNDPGINNIKMIHTWGSMLLKQIYDNHKDYSGITLYDPNVKFLWLGASFYSRERSVIDQIDQIIKKVINHSSKCLFL